MTSIATEQMDFFVLNNNSQISIGNSSLRN
jgi:hypothetical protein